MKKFLVIVCAALCLLTGCKGEEYETVSDVWSPEPLPEAQEIILDLPNEIAVPAMEETEEGALYLCDRYMLTTHITAGGDIQETILQTTGFEMEQLSPMATQSGDCKRYDCVWITAGEQGDEVCRAVILDDGHYHYVLTASTESKNAGKLQETWQNIFDSFMLKDTAA